MKRTCASALERLADRPAPGPDFTQLVELHDFLRVQLPRLSDKQRSVVVATLSGRTCSQIAVEEGVSEAAVHERLRNGLRRLRELAGVAV